MGEISNFYNLSARLLINNTHIPPIINTHTSKFRSFLSDTFWIMNFFFFEKGPIFKNFYNLSARLLIFNTHIPPIINTHTSKFRSCLSDTFWLTIFPFLKKGLFSKSISSDKFEVYDLELFFQYLRYI